MMCLLFGRRVRMSSYYDVFVVRQEGANEFLL